MMHKLQGLQAQGIDITPPFPSDRPMSPTTVAHHEFNWNCLAASRGS